MHYDVPFLFCRASDGYSKVFCLLRPTRQLL